MKRRLRLFHRLGSSFLKWDGTNWKIQFGRWGASLVWISMGSRFMESAGVGTTLACVWILTLWRGYVTRGKFRNLSELSFSSLKCSQHLSCRAVVRIKGSDVALTGTVTQQAVSQWSMLKASDRVGKEATTLGEATLLVCHRKCCWLLHLPVWEAAWRVRMPSVALVPGAWGQCWSCL